MHRLHLSSFKRLERVAAAILYRKDAMRGSGNQDGVAIHVKGAVGAHLHIGCCSDRNHVQRPTSNRRSRIAAPALSLKFIVASCSGRFADIRIPGRVR